MRNYVRPSFCVTPAGMSTSLTSRINGKKKHTHAHSLIPPWGDQCEWHRMTRMTGSDCAVMCNLINLHTHTHTHTHTRIRHFSRHYNRQPLRRLQSGECSTPCRKTPRRRSRAEEKQVSGLVSRYLLPPSSRYVDMW